MRTFFFFCLGFLCTKGWAQSSTQCKENEEYQECASGCPLTCENYRKPLFCTANCKTGCFCRPGYVKGPEDKCIRPTQCPIGPCKEGEIASTCINPCNNCIQKGKCYFEYCIKGCDCRPGYYRNSTDVCVPAEKCGEETHLCPPNEHYVPCVNFCNDCWSKGKCSSDQYCEAGCDCNAGYYRDDYGTCVHENECAHHDSGCGPNEIFTDCVNSCNDCEHKGHCDHYECHYGCDCRRGFYRNHNGLCISESECAATICGENEEYSECGSACPLHCSNTTTSSLCPNHCVKGCFCKLGYVRGPNGKCILQNECPPICREYEEYKECGESCVSTCENRAHIGDCSLPCSKGCFCKIGYIRGPKGNCILPENCPPVCGRNEEYQDCGSACPANCTNQNPTCRTVCVRGCFCKSGYIRDPYGICVLPTNCPLLCDKNEIFMSCGPRCEPSCDAIHRNPALCPACQRGCFCKPGYVRGPDGKCILPHSCPAACGEYEEFQQCGSPCAANCTNPNPTCVKTCVRGCFCKPGYIRNANFSCILPDACPVVCGEYEEFNQCGSLCPPTCDNQNPSCSAQCVKGCFCKSGYVRDENGKCILRSLCPEKCRDNENYQLCGTSCPITCNNIGKSVSCKLHCNRGCFCNDGYVRGPNGTCITPNLCPMRCGQHEVLKECGTACQPTCANYTSPGPCAASCVRGCFCRRGYVRNARGKCILKKHCPSRCKRNEVLTCSSRSCEITCDDDDDISHPCTGDCINGCYCRRGFVRAPDGECVVRSQCPRVIGFDGRNKGEGAEENGTVATLSFKPTANTTPLTTNTNFDLSTKLDKLLPFHSSSLPVVKELLDEAVSTPTNTRQVSTQTTSVSISGTKEILQMGITTVASFITTENQTKSLITKSPLKSSENPTASITTEPSLKSSENPAESTKSEILEDPPVSITETSLKSLENQTLAIDSLTSQTSIQNSIDSKLTSKLNTIEVENSTLQMKADNQTSNNPTSTMNSSTI